ncbi:DPO3-like protein, partial [Mya arenaria]
LETSNDKNHIVKNFGNELYKLKSKHKSLSNNNIAHIQKCFSYGISQNKGSTHGIKTSLDALPSHMFNEHSSCSPTLCKSLRDENYRQAHILQGTELRKDFQNVIHGGHANDTVGVSDIEIEHIEDIPPCPAECSETPHAYGQDDVIVFDLETTGLESILLSGTNSSIVQIAALHVSSGQHLNLFVKPKCGYIPTTASNITGLEFHDGVLYQHCKEVTSVAASEALLAFKRWLEAFGSHILLVAHNVMFDARLLVAKYQEEGITVPETIGFADSLRLFRTVYPGRQNYRLASLVHDIAGVDFGVHDASEDVYALSSILQLQTNLDKLSNYATTVSSVKFKLQELNNEKLYKGSYTTFVESKIISKAQATRLSRSGISIDHLKKVYSRSGLDGMQAVLKDRGAGKFYTKLASALDAVFSENKINLN